MTNWLQPVLSLQLDLSRDGQHEKASFKVSKEELHKMMGSKEATNKVRTYVHHIFSVYFVLCMYYVINNQLPIMLYKELRPMRSDLYNYEISHVHAVNLLYYGTTFCGLPYFKVFDQL